MIGAFQMKDSMGAFFGFTLFCVGVVAIAMGVWGLFSNSSIVGGFLVFGGVAAALSGARFASMVSNPQREIPIVGNFLFALCFIVSVFVLAIGLTGIFSNTLTSLYLMLVAFASAAISAWSVARRSRLG
jgi:magnesium-transporting ATPase (P-type)